LVKIRHCPSQTQTTPSSSPQTTTTTPTTTAVTTRPTAAGHRRRCRRLEQASRIASFLLSSPRVATWRHHFPSRETPTPRSVKVADDSAKPYQKRRWPPRCSKVLEPLLVRATPGLEATLPSLTVVPQLWSELPSLSPFDLCFTVPNYVGLWWWIWSVVLSCLWCIQILGGVCICVGGMALMIHGGIGLGLCVVDIVRMTLANLFNTSPFLKDVTSPIL